MGLYKLMYQKDIADGILITANPENIDYERSLENWLENSPNIALEEEGNTVLWLSRQETARVGDTFKRPDLMGVDSNGDVIIVELKKGKSPRDVVAQVLEYSAWASKLTYQDLNNIFVGYMNSKSAHQQELYKLCASFKEAFDLDDEIEVEFNKNQKIIIYAEDFPGGIIEVVDYLSVQGVSIKCIQYIVHKTELGEIFVSTEKVAGVDIRQLTTQGLVGERWDEDVLVKDVIHDAVLKLTQGNTDFIFSPKDIATIVKQKYPNVNRNTVGCQLIQDCVNHTSRRHYPGGQRDHYYVIEKGRYRLYKPKEDGIYDKEGKGSRLNKLYQIGNSTLNLTAITTNRVLERVSLLPRRFH